MQSITREPDVTCDRTESDLLLKYCDIEVEMNVVISVCMVLFMNASKWLF